MYLMGLKLLSPNCKIKINDKKATTPRALAPDTLLRLRFSGICSAESRINALNLPKKCAS